MASSRTTSSRSARSQHDHSPRGGVNQPTRTNRTNRGSLSPPRTLFQVLVAKLFGALALDVALSAMSLNPRHQLSPLSLSPDSGISKLISPFAVRSHTPPRK